MDKELLSLRNVAVGTMLVLALLPGVTSCRKTPNDVIPQEEMAQLLADIHKGEGVVETHRSGFRTDSMKSVLKQSIYAKHGVTAEQVDTSFVWYGHHIKEYMEVYTRVIEILEEEMDRTSALANADSQMAVSGDSADAWQWSKTYEITRMSPSRLITFALTPDENWEHGDVYSWAMKVSNNRSLIGSQMAVEYDDGSVEWIDKNISEDGWNRLELVLDSTKTATSVFGMLTFEPTEKERVFLDSVALVRTRVNRYNYGRRSSQKKITPIRSKPETTEEAADSTTTK